MTKSYKMLVLLAMLQEESFPGDLPIAVLTQGGRTVGPPITRTCG